MGKLQGTQWLSGNALHLYARGAWAVAPAALTDTFYGFLQYPDRTARIVPRLGQDIQYTFVTFSNSLFITHPTIHRCVVKELLKTQKWEIIGDNKNYVRSFFLFFGRPVSESYWKTYWGVAYSREQVLIAFCPIAQEAHNWGSLRKANAFILTLFYFHPFSLLLCPFSRTCPDQDHRVRMFLSGSQHTNRPWRCLDIFWLLRFRCLKSGRNDNFLTKNRYFQK